MEITISRLISEKEYITEVVETTKKNLSCDVLIKKIRNNKFYFINKYGIEITKRDYDYAEDFKDGLAKVGIKDKYGFIDENGKEIIKLKYDEVDSFKNGICKVVKKTRFNKEGKQGYIDKNGKEVIKVIYDWVDDFNEGVVVVKKDQKFIALDENGKKINKNKYDYISAFKDGVAIVYIEGPGFRKYSIVDKDGNELIEFKYSYISEFSEGLAIVRINGLYGYIDKEGNEVIKPVYYSACPFHNGYARVMERELWHSYEKWGVIDKSGKVIISPKYEELTDFDDGLARACIGSYFNNSKWILIDINDRKLIKEDYYAEISDFQEGLAPVCLSYDAYFMRRYLRFRTWNDRGPWGYIDKTGRIKIDYSFTRAYPFKDGLAVIKKYSYYGVIDKNGEFVAESIYDNICYFDENGIIQPDENLNLGRSGSEYIVLKKDDKYGLINKEGQVIADAIYKDIKVKGDKLVFEIEPEFDIKNESCCGPILETNDTVIHKNNFSYEVLIQYGNKSIIKKFDTPQKQTRYYNMLKKEVEWQKEKLQVESKQYIEEILEKNDRKFEKIKVI